MKEFDYAVFIGRFQPWHNVHEEIALQGLKIANKLIIVLGSHNKPRTIDNPWKSEERKKYITTSILSKSDSNQIYFATVPDRFYNEQLWLSSVNSSVNKIISNGEIYSPKIALIGHHKDESSYWIKMFPQWSFKDAGTQFINATDIRKSYFCREPDWKILKLVIPDTVFKYLSDEFYKTEAYEQLSQEMEFVKNYNSGWLMSPNVQKYGIKHVTVDSVVIQSGHILLVRRGAEPGKGLWALPGGHVNINENLDEHAAIRELREETRLKVPKAVLQGSMKCNKIFGHPRRSTIGRVITVAYLFELQPTEDGMLPKVKGSDDADKARWIQINELNEEEMFDDHYQIALHMIGIL